MKYFGFGLGLLALLLNGLFGYFPSLVNTLYYKGIFQIIRIVYDHTLGFLPLPMVYVLFFILVFWIAQVLSKLWAVITISKPWKEKLLDFIPSFLNPLGFVVFGFYLMWGWNYQRTPFETRMGFPKVSADTTVLVNEAYQVMEELIVLRKNVIDDALSMSYNNLPKDMESQIRNTQETLINSWGEPTFGRVRIRKLRPKGILLRIATAGVYIPFVCEGHIDAGLHPLQYPFTMAHEMAHGYGYTDEGVCNFVGFITCINSEDDMIHYAGLLGYWRYVLSNLRQYAPHTYRKLRKEMHTPLARDLNDIADQMDLYPDIFPDIRNAVYDSYLKSHGVKKGIANYNDIVRLVAQYKKSIKDLEIDKRE